MVVSKLAISRSHLFKRGATRFFRATTFAKKNYSKTKGIALKALKQGSMNTKGIESKFPQVLQRTSRRSPSEFFWNHADLGVMCPRSVVPDFKPS